MYVRVNDKKYTNNATSKHVVLEKYILQSSKNVLGTLLRRLVV